MKKKGTPLGKFEFDKIFLSGSEIFALYKMYDDSNNKKKLRISTDEDNEFKRNYDEWEPEKIDSYIKSIADDFPHTPMYVLEDKETQEWYVVDGQHRMTTIINYLGNSNIGLIQFENVKNSEETNTFYEVYKNLFEIVIIKSKYSVKNQKTEFFNQLEDIFFRLNNTANPINEYLFYKSIFSKKNRIKTKKLEKSFNEFQKIKTENPNKVFERLVRIALMISKDINEIKKIDSLSKAYREYILGDDFKEESLDILLDIIKEFKRKNFYLSDFTKDLTTTLGIFKLASENNYNQIMEVAKHIIELEKSFRKNTRKINFRAPDVWFLKYYMLKEFRVLEGEKEKVNESRYDEFIKWLLSEKRSGKKDDK